MATDAETLTLKGNSNPQDTFPHDFIYEINAATQAKYNFRAFDLPIESDMCREHAQ